MGGSGGGGQCVSLLLLLLLLWLPRGVPTHIHTHIHTSWSALESSAVVIRTSSTLLNWWSRTIPLTSCMHVCMYVYVCE